MRRQRIYCVTDGGRQWVQQKRLELLKTVLGDEFEFKDITRSFGLRRRLSDRLYLPCYFVTWRLLIKDELWKRLPLERCMASVTSHYNIGGGLDPSRALGKLSGDPEGVFERTVTLLKRFAVVTVNSMRLFELLSPHIKSLVYLPNGVDESFFEPRGKKEFNPKQLRIGWTGKIKAAKNYELVERCKALFREEGVDFVEIALDKSDRAIRSASEMKDFYRGLDFYLCTSVHEGTPNPCLEAASSGVPLLTTRVGNMPELVRDKSNSFFIDPDLDSVRNVLHEVRNLSRDRYSQMSQELRHDVETNWTWTKQLRNYRRAFHTFSEKVKEGS